MRMTLKEIARILDGTIIGRDDIIINNVMSIEDAGEGDITFIIGKKYAKKLEITQASAIIAPPQTVAEGKSLVIVADPYAAFGKLLALFYPLEHGQKGISPDSYIEEGAIVSPEANIFPKAFISRGAKIERGAFIYPGVYIGRDASIGENSVIYANVTIYHSCIIGKRVVLHSGVVVGADGFGFANSGRGNEKIPQVGYVQIDDDVEIGANTTIDRATLGKTWIGRNVKIDNLVQVAHNVSIGENSAIAAQTGISGSTKIGRGVIIGGQVGIVGHISIGDHAMIGASSNIHKDIPADQVGGGSPFLPYKAWLKVESSKIKLPEIRVKLERLIKQVEQLEAKIIKTGED
ncbi:MAG: UDP-3-O-(3-hydroxymyristoyl)glucosamine N-acyltransferase [Deltaproteobacteria bacterium RBG_19FT_COMBO_43_11]|nr:MAG: UDP-3-O-(3-hydroxymyristoyl)glucosamine N-acyltransferase [Deltaproteobacteria bacterium RBG_19FT_COMBO_43_11]